MATPQESKAPPDEQQNRSLRVTLSYKGRQIKAVSARAITMRPNASDSTYDYERQSGCWCELRDANDRVIYRRVMQGPIGGAIEAPSGDPERPFTHIESKGRKGVLTLLLPDLNAARTLVLYDSPAEKPGEPASEIARFDLRKLRTGKEKR